MKQKILDLFMDMIISKTDNYQEDYQLETAISDYIDDRSLVEKWKKSGFTDNYLGVWLTPYLAPVKSLNFEQAVNYFKDYALLRKINAERVFFMSLDKKKVDKTSTESIQKRYDNLCNKLAPLIESGRYKDYVRTLLSLVKTEIEHYNHG